ncbi:MAG: molybdopterin-dependent oxidoreductase, partial [Armatimonadetes bacterium]|nr:molybdopterin-dependent oxidoreductase [Armatimonadota bacterium]
MRYRVVGKRVPRLDGPAHVTGLTRFTGDLALPGMAWGVLLRSPHPHARIVSVEADRASHMPGVLAVAVGEDARGLAREKVRYHGEAVAAVAAETRGQALAAAEAIEVTYDPLPVVTDVRSAMQPNAAHVHEESESREFPNVCDETTVKRGDIAKGFASADHIFEDTFETPWVHQGYLEPHSSIAEWDASGKLTVWTSTQAQFGVRSALCRALKLPMSRVRVIGMPVGGGFGGKGGVILEP